MDPYVKILNTMKSKGAESNSPTICVGQVISPPPNLIVQTKDLQLYKDDIYIADYLLSGYERNVAITDGNGTTITTTDAIKIGDKLAIMPTSDLQTWIILCKVVEI